jgi:hypothetical protein
MAATLTPKLAGLKIDIRPLKSAARSAPGGGGTSHHATLRELAQLKRSTEALSA